MWIARASRQGGGGARQGACRIGLLADQRGEALLDRARAAEAQNDFKTARAKVTAAAENDQREPVPLVLLGGAGDPGE